MFILQLVGKAKSCEVLQRSVNRFYGRAFPGKLSSSRNRKSICNGNVCSPNFIGMLNQVLVQMSPNSECEEYPHDKMKEACK